MDRRIRDTLHKAGASDEYIMSRRVEVSIRKPTGDERRKGEGRRRYFAAPEEYIKESVTSPAMSHASAAQEIGRLMPFEAP